MDLEIYMKEHNVKKLSISRKVDEENVLSNRDRLICSSERAYGTKRGRIDEWSHKVRGGDY